MTIDIERVRQRVEIAAPNLQREDTNLDVYVHYRVKPDEKHKTASIKVNAHNSKFKNKDSACIDIEDEPYVIEPKNKSLSDIGISPAMFRKIVYWIKQNQKILLEFWYSDDTTIQSKSVKSKLKKVPRDWKVIPIEGFPEE